MRGILLYILIFLGLSVAGCRGGRSYDSRLAAADSLVASQPDSALRLLRGVGFDSMCSDADRAYFALLLTQAKYKCDEIITSTDTIDIAVDYFSGGGDADKRLRSLIYRGASLTDMGEITAAMEAYKQAEAAASPNDYENLGYINLRMASLYQKVYAKNFDHIDKYKIALMNFYQANDKHYQLVCLSRLGQVYRLVNMDSAYLYIKKAIELSRELNDSLWLFMNYEFLSGYYMKIGNLQKQKETALYVIKNGQKYADYDCYYILSRAYANLGKTDSAKVYFYKTPQIRYAAEQEVSRLATLREIAISENDYKLAYKYLLLDKSISDSLTSSKYSISLSRFEKLIEDERISFEKNLAKKESETTMWKLLVIILLLIAIIFAILWKRHVELSHYILEIQTLKNNYASAKEIIKENIRKLDSINGNDINSGLILSIKDSFEIQFEQIKKVIQIVDGIDNLTQQQIKFKLNKAIHSFDKTSQIANYVNLINLTHNNAIERLKVEFPSLDETDLNLIALTLLGLPNSFICFMLDYKNRQSVINRRNSIIKKLKITDNLKDFLLNY